MTSPRTTSPITWGHASSSKGRRPANSPSAYYRSLGRSRVRVCRPVPAPWTLADLPQVGAARAGGPLPSATQRTARQRGRQVGGHRPRAEWTPRSDGHQHGERLLEQLDELLLRARDRAHRAQSPRSLRRLEQRLSGVGIHAPGRRATAPSSSRTAGARTGARAATSGCLYYDQSFGKALAVFDGVKGTGNHDAIYQYDALGPQRAGWGSAASRRGSPTASGAPAPAASPPSPSTPPSCGTAYEVRVAASLDDVAAAPVAARRHAARRRLPHRRPQTAGHGAHRESPSSSPCRSTTPGWADAGAARDAVGPRRPASARPGQSFMSADGANWTDLTDEAGFEQANVCLKAFVDSGGAADTRRPGRGGRRYGAAGRHGEVPWHLRDPAFSSGARSSSYRLDPQRQRSGEASASLRSRRGARRLELSANWPQREIHRHRPGLRRRREPAVDGVPRRSFECGSRPARPR